MNPQCPKCGGTDVAQLLTDAYFCRTCQKLFGKGFMTPAEEAADEQDQEAAANEG